MTTDHKHLNLFLVSSLLLVALWFRFPQITSGMPYFYSEDEAHHFNRVTEMVKEGRWDPEYFHKPSLHFYLRMPILAVSFLNAVRNGEIRSVKEIRTRDPFGLSGYNFTASHPSIVKWNRAFSVALSLASLLLVALITLRLTNSAAAASISALLFAVSTEEIAYSATIGVDVVMMFFVLLSTYLAVGAVQAGRASHLYLAALCAGLACSSKYNALPVVFVPFVSLLFFKGEIFTRSALCLISFVVGFFIASPYILSSLPLFLDQFAYEIWHYGVAGHAGHSAEPGLPQAIFYLKWLGKSAIGWVALIAVVLGAIFSLRRNDSAVRGRSACIVALVFPALFFLLMVAQKTNFERNMVVILPFCAILVGVFISNLRTRIVRFPTLILAPLILAQPLFASLSHRHEVSDGAQARESRNELFGWVGTQPMNSETAVAGELQLPTDFYSLGHFSRITAANTDERALILAGYDRLILGNLSPAEEPIITPLRKQIHSIPGELGKSRVVRDPEIRILDLNFPGITPDLTKWIEGRDRYTVQILPTPKQHHFYIECPEKSPSEDYCWINSRLSKVKMGIFDPYKSGNGQIQIEAMTPWEGQSIILGAKEKQMTLDLTPGKWQKIVIPFALLRVLDNASRSPTTAPNIGADFYLGIAKVSSPKVRKISEDSRRLGVAIRGIMVSP